MRRLLLLVATAVLFTISTAAQSIAPAPTAAGYPFWPTTQGGKITRGKDGNIWFLDNGKVARFSPKTGTIKEWTVDVNPDGTSRAPRAIYWGTDGNIWWGDFYGVVGKLNPSTGAVTRYQVSSKPISDITAGPDGNMWAAGGLSIFRITTSGAVTAFATGLPSGRTTSFIRTGPDGNIWYTETFGGAIARMSTSGVVKNVWTLNGAGSACSTCAALTAGPDGNIWIAQNDLTKQLVRITMSGQITYIPIQTKGSGDICWGHDGNIWFTSPNDAIVGRINPGDLTQTYFEPVGMAAQNNGIGDISSAADGNIYFTGINPNAGAYGGSAMGIGKIVEWIPSGVSGTYIHATHGTQFSGEVASFYDFEVISSSYFKGTINWGDGHTTTAYFSRTSSGSPNYFQVHGTHTYASKGTYNVTISATEPGDKWKFTIKTQASVQ